MSQQSLRIVDVTKTYTPVDPQVIEANRVSENSDARTDRNEGVIAYEGYNFLPTNTGYKSFFGINSMFDIAACPAIDTVDKVFIFESSDGTNRVVVLSATGIWVNKVDVSNAPWFQAVVIAAPAVGVHKLWSTCIIDDTLYAYQQGGAGYYKLAPTLSNAVLPAIIPSFLNMPTQQGIFKAGGRLGFWDTESSVAWSSFDDHADFTPSITTLAGSAVFNEVRGAITSILTFGDGFVIYATNSIVYVARDLANTFQWNPSVLMAGSGVAYMSQIVSASPDTTHYCYTGIGLHEISGGKIEPIAVPITDFLRESLEPVMLRLIENRYLCLQMIDPRMIDGYTEMSSTTYLGPASPAETARVQELAEFNQPTPLADIAFS